MTFFNRHLRSVATNLRPALCVNMRQFPIYTVYIEYNN